MSYYKRPKFKGSPKARKAQRIAYGLYLAELAYERQRNIAKYKAPPKGPEKKDE